MSLGAVIVTDTNGRPTLHVAYFFSRVKRKTSIGEFLRAYCVEFKCGLILHEIDILVEGSEHDLIDEESQGKWINRVENGKSDVPICAPPCGS